MHKVINRFVQTRRKNMMFTTNGIIVGNIISRKSAKRTLCNRAGIFPGIFSDVTVHGGGKPVPESGLDQSLLKELTDDLQGIDGFLTSLCWKAVNQIGMNHDSRSAEMVAHLCRLTNGYAFVHELQQPVRGRFQSAGDGHTA